MDQNDNPKNDIWTSYNLLYRPGLLTLKLEIVNFNIQLLKTAAVQRTVSLENSLHITFYCVKNYPILCGCLFFNVHVWMGTEGKLKSASLHWNKQGRTRVGSWTRLFVFCLPCVVVQIFSSLIFSRLILLGCQGKEISSYIFQFFRYKKDSLYFVFLLSQFSFSINYVGYAISCECFFLSLLN